jgi:hypothetical protein
MHPMVGNSDLVELASTHSPGGAEHAQQAAQMGEAFQSCVNHGKCARRHSTVCDCISPHHNSNKVSAGLHSGAEVVC